jgi:hypothetical protein
MDLSLPLIGVLGLIGYNLNKEVNSREYTDKRVKIPVSELSSDKTIYESKKYVQGVKNEQTKLNKFYKNTNSILNTNKYTVNTTYKDQTKRAKRVRFSQYDSDKDVKDSIPRDESIHAGPMFETDKYFIPEDNGVSFDTKETFVNISKLSGNKTDFGHNNMVPFYKGKAKSTNDFSNTLSRYSGTDKPRRQEVKAPKPNPRELVYGSRAFTLSLNKDRFNLSSNNTENNILPFRQDKVVPIPGEYVRPVYKTVDELRASSKPKSTELKGRINPGSGNYQRAIETPVPKNKVNRFYDNCSSRYLITGNRNKNGPIQTNYTDDFRYTSKGEIMEVPLNKAAAFYKNGQNVIPLTNEDDGTGTFHTKDKRNTLVNDWVRNNRQQVGLRYEEKQNTIYLPEQERESTSRMEIRNANDQKRGDRIRFVNKLKTTNKELGIYTHIPSANAQASHLPTSRESYTVFKPKQKLIQENYTAGGGNIFSNRSGVESVNISSKMRPTVENYTNVPLMNNTKIPTPVNIGSNYNKKYEQTEHDFSDRIILNSGREF